MDLIIKLIKTAILLCSTQTKWLKNKAILDVLINWDRIQVAFTQNSTYFSTFLSVSQVVWIRVPTEIQ